MCACTLYSDLAQAYFWLNFLPNDEKNKKLYIAQKELVYQFKKALSTQNIKQIE